MSDTSVVAPASVPTEASSGAEPAALPKESAIPQEPRKFKLKVDGQEWEADENELTKYAQIGRAKEKRFEDAAKLRKEAEERMDRLKKDWVSVLKEQGISREDIEKYLGGELRKDMMSPEEKARLEFEQEKKAFEDAKAEA